MIWNERIKQLRLKEGLTLKEVAKSLGISEATAQRYENENGIKNIPYESLEKYAALFGVSRMLHFQENPVIMQKSRSCGVFQYNGWHRNPRFGTIFQ